MSRGPDEGYREERPDYEGYREERPDYGDNDRGWDRGRDYEPPFGDIPIRRRDIPNYLAQAIPCTLFCCLPFGIVAIVQAAQVNTKLSLGDYAGAQKSSDQAKMWCWISFALGLIATPFIIYFQILADRELFR